MASLSELFCRIDDFCQGFELEWEKRLLTDGEEAPATRIAETV